VILTVHDSIGVPTIRRDTGIDTPRLIGLLSKHRFSLQIEDPEVLWKTDPRRYVAIGERYRKLLPAGQADQLMLDINVMARVKTLGQVLFPTIQQTGTEFDELLASAGKVVRRATIYCEDTVWSDDWVFASEAFAAGAGNARREGAAWQAALRRGAILNLDTGEQNLTLDGRDWPILGDGEILLPPGQHRLAVSQRSGYGWAPPLRIDRATVDLVHAEPVSGGLRVTYDAAGPGSISLDVEAYRVALEDGRALTVDRSAGDTMVMVPAGRHTLTINQEEPWHWGVSAASFYCSTGVTIIAGSAITLLTLLYGSVRRRRRRGFGFEEEDD